MESYGRPYLAFRHPEFRRFAIAWLVSLLGTQMQNVAIDWHVYVLTHSPLALGAIGLTRVVPVILFSLWGGIVADRRDRRTIMLVTQTLLTGVAVTLSILTLTGRDRVALIYLMTALAAGAAAFDNPARHALVPRLVPVADLPGALSIMLTTFQLAAIGGPALAGLLIAHGGTLGLLPDLGGTRGLAVIYVLNALSFGGVISVLATMRTSGAVTAPAGETVPPLTALREGLAFVFRTPVMVWTMLLDFFATFFSGSMSLLPIFADQVLSIGAVGYGWLRAAPGVGAVIGAAYTSLRRLPTKQGRVFLGAVAAYGAATVLFGLSRLPVLTLASLALVGLTDTVSTVVRQTVRQLVTPDALRGRMTSVNMIFFMGGPQLGELEAGFVASLFASAVIGVTVAVVSGGVATIAVAAFVAAVAPAVREYDVNVALKMNGSSGA